MAKKRGSKKCISFFGHFDGHGGVPEQFRWCHPMKHVQGYPGSHWMPPLSAYLLYIVPAAPRATANEKAMKKWTNIAGHFDGHGGVPVQYCMQCPMEEIQGVGRSHWTLPSGEYCQ
jgi:hypothetical protein